MFSHIKKCFRSKTNGLIYPYKVVVAKHLMDIPSWPPFYFMILLEKSIDLTLEANLLELRSD